MSRFLSFGIVSCVVFGAARVSRADDAEDRAAAFVKERGGEVVRDESRPGKPVVRVSLRYGGDTGEQLRALAPLQDLVALDLSDTRVTDGQLKELPVLRKLTALDLRSARVTAD